MNLTFGAVSIAGLFVQHVGKPSLIGGTIILLLRENIIACNILLQYSAKKPKWLWHSDITCFFFYLASAILPCPYLCSIE